MEAELEDREEHIRYKPNQHKVYENIITFQMSIFFSNLKKLGSKILII